MNIYISSLKGNGIKGFTLMELLFVLVVLGVLSMAGILFYQQRMQAQKIEKTVSQMEQWLQAGMAYYVRNNKWPTDAKLLERESYMPVGASNESPWCKEPSSTEPSTCYTVGVMQGGQRWGVTVTGLPPAPEPRAGIPQSIAARLVYAAPVVRGQTLLTAEINVPLAAIHQPKKIFMGILPFALEDNELVTQDDFMVMRTSQGKYLGKLSSCNTLYGSQYQFKSYPVVAGYSVNHKDGGRQQPGFSSYLQVESTVDPLGHVFLASLKIRSQFYKTRYEYLGGPLYSEKPPAKLIFTVHGQIFVFCEKKT